MTAKLTPDEIINFLERYFPESAKILREHIQAQAEEIERLKREAADARMGRPVRWQDEPWP
jgi:hypothetical protein